ncbi:MAG: AAA family ATPase [Magnetococcales bacterium]|nr:AAA family ATPase [Magnetococcales bacterium]
MTTIDILRDHLLSLGVQVLPSAIDEWKTAGFLEHPKLEWANHFSAECDLFVCDAELGCLGFVIDVTTLTAQTIKTRLRKQVNQAAYVRHLLLSRLKEGEELPLSVDLVLLLKPNAMPSVASTLQEMARTGDQMYAIGINLLPINEGGLETGDFTRAFSWLLLETRSWFNTLSSNGSLSDFKLTLENYRAIQKRSLTFTRTNRDLKLVYGRNGTGKSTLTESLELLLTGRVERLDRDKTAHPLLDAIRSQSNLAAEPKIRLGTMHVTVTKTGLKPPPKVTLPSAAAFRLDQVVMNRLAIMGDTERAKVLLEAFFPEATTLVEQNTTLRERQKNLLSVLQEKPPQSLSEWEILLPLNQQHLINLRPASPGIVQFQAEWRRKVEHADFNDQKRIVSSLVDTLKILKEEADSSPTLPQSLQRIVAAMTRLKDWQPTRATTDNKDRATLLNNWLEAVVLADLAQKRHVVAATLVQAKKQRWQNSTGESWLEPEENADHWQQLRNKYRDQETQAFSNLQTLQTLPKAQGKTTSPPYLSADEVAALDQLGRWALTPEERKSLPGLGQLVQDAIRTNSVRSVSSNLSIGGKGWTDGFRSVAEAVLALIRCSTEELHRITDYLDNRESLEKSDQQVNDLFYANVLELQKPLNELMALMTPARWAYNDLRLQRNADNTLGLADGKEGLRADLRLNTAELNLFTLVLFLLLAPRVEKNHLKLMVLDDPLQNMDEHTVVALARGLTRYRRLLPNGWDMLLLFHGEDDMLRFRQEAPVTVFRLPWMNPVNTVNSEKEIESDDSLSVKARVFQSLKEHVRYQ